jgi:hypothetical protein
MKRRFFLLSCLASVALTAPVFANDIYIAQASAGSNNGSSCANAYAYSYFNTSGNWTTGVPSATKIGPGSTVHICGTITVGANTEALIFQGSGTSSSPVTLYFESGAVLASPYWPAPGSGGAVDIGSNDYLVINGNGGAGGAAQGIIEATSNGDAGATCLSGACQYHEDASNGIEGGSGASNITIEGLTIEDLYVTASGVPSGGGGYCIYDHGQVSNWTITNNLMHDMAWCVQFQFDSGTSSGITISNNQIYNIDHGIAIGGPHAGNTITNVNVFGNNIHDYSNWDTPGDVWHHDGIHIWGYNDDGSDTITGVNIYNNTFGGCVGQNVTAHVFVEANGGSTKNVKIYNNSLIDTCNGGDGDGLLTTGQDGGYQIYNNTFMGTAGDTCVGTSNSPNTTFVNNVVSGCGTLMYVTSGGSFTSGGLHNNIYAACSSSNCFAFPGGYTTSFAAWQSYTGQDASPSADIASAGLSPAGVPQSGSPLIGAGVNLTSLGIAALNTDIAGNARPSTGSWTIGAYSNSGPTPQPPTGLTGTIAEQ